MNRSGRIAGALALAVATTAAAAMASASAPAQVGVADAGLHPATRTPPPRQFTVVAGGDIVPEIPVLEAGAAAAAPGARFAFGPMFAPVRTVVEAADLAICHLETPVGPPGAEPGLRGRTPGGAGLLLTPYELAVGVREAGFDRCSTASNHSNDFGAAGIAWTLDVLDELGLGHAGTARTVAEATTPALVAVRGVRVAHLAYSRYSNTPLTGEGWRIASARTVAEVVRDVEAARQAGAEVVIVSVHVLKEQEPGPIAQDRQFVADLTAAVRVDLVIGHGPHVVQPVEQLNGAWVYWSVGNFVSGMGRPGSTRYGPRTLDGLLADVRFVERARGGFDVIPGAVAICNEMTDRTVYPAVSALADPLIDPELGSQLADCLARTRAVVPEVG